MAAENEQVILLDVGGTNSRLYSFEKETFKAEKICVFKPKDSIELKFRVRDEVKNKYGKNSKIGICGCFAGRVFKDKKIASVTKWGEIINTEKLFDFLDQKRAIFFNDAEAAVFGLNFIKERAKKEIFFGMKKNVYKKPFSLLYLGTGLGAASFYNSAAPSEISAINMPLREKERKRLKIRRDFLLDDLVSGRGLSTIARLLYKKSMTPEKISKEISSGRMEEAGKLFARFLGRATKIFALTQPVETIFLGGKPTEAFTEKFYNEFIREFLSDKINSWWLKEIAICKLDPHLELPLEGLKFLASKMVKEKID